MIGQAIALLVFAGTFLLLGWKLREQFEDERDEREIDRLARLARMAQP